MTWGNSTAAEAFDDFLDHAEAYLHGGRKMEAGVIAGVVFEDTIFGAFTENQICRRQRSKT